MTAFRNADSTVAVQVINNSNKVIHVAIQGLPVKSASKVTSYTTDNGNNLTAGSARVIKGGIQDSIPAHAMVSYVT